MYSIPARKKPENCDHKSKKDLTHGKGRDRNIYCPDCKTHWWKGKEWSPKEWDEYING